MTKIRVFVTGIGIISPLGNGLNENKEAVKLKKSGIKPLSLFPVPENKPLPVGEISQTEFNNIPWYDISIPRTHNLALIAAKEAVKEEKYPPEAIILGTTTGGIDVTENLIKEKKYDPNLYKYHSAGSVTEYIAQELDCKGIILTVSTACSSGTLAIKLALELLRTGMVKTVLTGGADALCRLTYHGFNSLQLIDPAGARPLDKDRKGMSIAEGAAMLLLTAAATPPANAIAEILGAGVTCDAYHPASPHPEGVGAANAIKAALKDACISFKDIDYINLHGTGTIDNDMSEAKALHTVFGNSLPGLSSTKGAYGHPLAAAGAIEAAISIISITEGIVPENIGCKIPDPDLDLNPSALMEANVDTVLSNSFGFGGNNASVIICNPEKYSGHGFQTERKPLTILGYACVTGAGCTEDTDKSLQSTGKCSGIADINRLTEILPRNKLRRLKRLSKMVLSLTAQTAQNAGNINPKSVCLGTGFGALTETYDFLEKLYESCEKFPSPTDFVGSVHNAPAGQAAIWFGATGPNITSTGGDYSFEQALLCASLLSGKDDSPVMVIGADEYHDLLSKTLDRSAALENIPSDGGGAFLLKQSGSIGLKLFLSFFEYYFNNEGVIINLINKLGGIERIKDLFGAVFVGIPAFRRSVAAEQLNKLINVISFGIPVFDYRKFTGEFASASAVASVIAAGFVVEGTIPSLSGNEVCCLNNKGILIIGLGDYITAIEIYK